MKKFLIVLGIVVISLVAVKILKDLIIKSVATAEASSITGAPVHMDGFSMNIFSSTIHITGFKMYNPGGFPEGMLVSCPKINVIFDRASLFTQKPHLLLVDVELKEMVLTKNKEGKLSVDSLKIVHPPKSSAPVHMQIDLLNLSIGKIIYEDYTAGTQPSVRVFDVNRQKSYKSIPTAQQLALLVLAEPMKAAAIKNAEIYGVALVAGVAVLPVAVAATFMGKDDVQQTIDASFEHAYETSLEVVKRMGKITKQDISDGVIKANINGSAVALTLRKGGGNKTEITVSARKYMLPELDIAGGVLYQILDKL
jgi:hypothetical protein